MDRGSVGLTWLCRVVGVMCSPLRRAKAIRKDDQAQVMVLTGVMVFIVSIMAISTFNAGTLMYNRVRAQNAVDAAADSFAAYQSRGLNLAQHLNDLHYDINWAIFVLESIDFGIRITCPLQAIRPPPIFFDFGWYRTCCNLFRTSGEVLDSGQNMAAELIFGVQELVNIVFPLIGMMNANGLAEANGADKIWNILGDSLSALVGLFGVPEATIQDAFQSIADIPYLGEIYVLPTKFDQIFDLNIAEMQDPNPNNLPWDTKNIIRGLVIASDIACVASGDYAILNEPNHDWGWRDDTFYCGGPSYNTWIAGMRRRNAFPGMEKVAWLNPRMRAREQRVDLYSYQRKYGVFDHRSSTSVRTSFRNPVMLVMASSQVDGSPLMERSGHREFTQYAHPSLISVHTDDPGTDSDTTGMLIWH